MATPSAAPPPQAGDAPNKLKAATTAKVLGLFGVASGLTLLAGVMLEQSGNELAMSDIYGGNAMQLTFFFLADLLAGDPVLPTASSQSLWLGATGAVVTGIIAYGLLVRNDRKVAGIMGRHSLLALLVYVGAVALLTAVPG